MFNDDNETDEEHIKWEIERDWTRKYYRRNMIATMKNCKDEIIAIANHRKEVNCEGEVLIIWHGGMREWHKLSLAHHDSKEKVEKYLKDNNLTKEMMDMKNYVKKKKNKKNKDDKNKKDKLLNKEKIIKDKGNEMDGK